MARPTRSLCRSERFRRALALGAPIVALAFSGRDALGAEVLKGPYVQALTSSSAVVRVELDTPSPLRVEGGARGQERAIAVEEKEARRFHSVRVTGLTPSTRYEYTVHMGKTHASAAFTTAPPPDTTAPTRFVIYGDNRTDHAAHAALVRGMSMTSAEFFLQTGDLVAVGGNPDHWKAFFEIEAPILRERCIFAAIGNHELHESDGVEFARYFGPHGAPPLPDVAGPAGDAGAHDPRARDAGRGGRDAGGGAGRDAGDAASREAGVGDVSPEAGRPAGSPTTAHLTSTFRWGAARFILLNGMVSYDSGPDRAFLEKALADADNEPGVTWRVIALHHGPWSSGPHGENTRLHKAGIVPLLKAHKVDLVLSGHDHLYERGFVDGIAYIVSGGGGAPLYPVKNPQKYMRKASSTHHFVEALMTREAIGIEVHKLDGTVFEKCSLKKGVGWDCDKERPPAPAKPAPASRCGCRAVGSAHWGAGGLALAVALLTIAVRRRARRVVADP